MQYDRPEGAPDEKIGWGSDVAATMLRRFGFPYVSLNPGASYRGLHDSIVNHLGNEMPSMIMCLHEDHAVAIAHGYAKATGEPMACILHSNVGLMHGMMGLYNAWCDRVPMFVLGATGPLDSTQRRPWIDWIHSSSDQASLIREYIKWDNQPTSAGALVEAMCRANIVTRTEPTAPVYICLDAGLQESSLDKVPEIPDVSRFQPPPPPRPTAEAVARAAALLAEARRPVMLIGRSGISMEAWNARVKLAERLGACVMTDLKTRAAFPNDHAAQVVQPFNQMPAAGREILAEADVVLALEWLDLGNAVGASRTFPAIGGRVISATLDPALHNGAHMNYLRLAAVDVPIAASSDALVSDLLEALGPGHREPWRRAKPAKARGEETRISVATIATSLRAAIDDPDAVGFVGLCRSWPCEVWPFRSPQSYLGKDGGGGIGSGPGLSVGGALGLHTRGKLPIAVLGDGDFCMGASAIWSAVHSRIPLLVLINNNRSYFNDELHQETVARRRNRPASNRWIGQRLSNPEINISKFAEAQGAVGIGPIKSIPDLDAAIAKGLGILKSGGVCVIDVHVDPGEERSAATTETRPI